MEKTRSDDDCGHAGLLTDFQAETWRNLLLVRGTERRTNGDLWRKMTAGGARVNKLYGCPAHGVDRARSGKIKRINMKEWVPLQLEKVTADLSNIQID